MTPRSLVAILSLTALQLACAATTPRQSWQLHRSNPGPLPAPSPGTFSRVVTVPVDSELVFLTGQTGTRPDGSTPETIEEQVEVALSNVKAILAAQGMDSSHVVKVTFYQTAKSSNRERMRAAWKETFGATPPATTLIFVPELARPEYKFEIDVVAAKPASRRSLGSSG
jgi:2-iminobutanoate/2-iminopropanoate deaminase